MNSAVRRGQVSTAAVYGALIGLSLVAAFGMYLSFVSGKPFEVDRLWLQVVELTPGTAPFAVAVALAEIGSGIGGAACTVIAAAALFVLRRRRDALAVMFATGLGVMASELVKALVMRPRPAGLLYPTSGFSYPSGHSMGAAALAVSLMLVVWGYDESSRTAVRWSTFAAAAYILLMMWSRTALQVHWLSDVVAGAVLGVSAAILSRRLWIGDGSPTRRLERPR